MSTDDDDSPYHAGERAVQLRAGVRLQSERMGQRMIRSAMPEQHSLFFAELPFVLVGSVDARGQPWASMLFGPLGFVDSPEPERLEVHALPPPADPLSDALRPGAPLGVLGIQLETRRRNRVNGRVLTVDEHGFSLSVDQSFGNCPKFITPRRPLRGDADEASSGPAPTPEGPRLSEIARRCIATADTAFIASTSARSAGQADRREGVDVSHRGGKPGFIRVADDADGSTLLLPDYAGNNAFNTLGNVERYPHAGLLLPDFEHGHLLQLTCQAEIRWQAEELAHFQGAERLVQLRIQSGWLFPRAMPLRWSAPLPEPIRRG